MFLRHVKYSISNFEANITKTNIIKKSNEKIRIGYWSLQVTNRWDIYMISI